LEEHIVNRKPTYTELTKSVIELTTALDYERKKKAECEDILENANSLILKMSPDGIMRVVTKDARELIIEYRNSIIYDHGKPIGVHGAARDITRRVKTEEQLRISEEKFSKVFRNSPMWVVLSVVETGRYIDVNDSFLCSTGYQRDEVINKTSIELGLWVDPDQRKKILKEVKEKGSVQDIEVNRRIKSGQIITMLFFGEIIEIGEETCFLSVSLDITDRKRMEMLVRESEKRYRTVLQVNPDPIVLYDINGKVTYANPAFEKTFGWTYNELAETSGLCSKREPAGDPSGDREYVEG
jgi:PAS domain S-box-containing protein